MKVNEYLERVLRDQTLPADSEELETLREHRKKVEALLKRDFKDSPPTVRYGGSIAKGTMIKAAYDLDLPCYFGHEDERAGKTLKEIYNNVKTALEKEYLTTPKTSVIRLHAQNDRSDFHIDVVPGRFVDGKDGDVFLYQAGAEKERLKTNLDTHIGHIRDSGVVDAIRLIKYWRERNRLSVKTFVLELLVVDMLKKRKDASLDKQLTHVWTQLRDNANDLAVEDPANPTGNELSNHLDNVRSALAATGRVTLTRVEAGDWQEVFGKVEEESKNDKVASLGRVAATVSTREKPWCSGE